MERLQNAERLKELIQALEKAYMVGFASQSSPVDLLIDVMIDTSLLLKGFLLEKKDVSKNPGIKFLETQQDVLGNPKQVQIPELIMDWYNPNASKFFASLAVELVKMKQFHKHRYQATEALLKFQRENENLSVRLGKVQLSSKEAIGILENQIRSLNRQNKILRRILYRLKSQRRGHSNRRYKKRKS
jgi:hypothetical protein